MRIQQKLLLIGLATVMVGGFVYSQVYFQNEKRRDLREIAGEIAQTWQEKLNLTPVQTSHLKDIIISYTLRKNIIINSSSPEHKKINRLKKVQVKEHKILRKVLTEDQFNNYIGTNKKIPNNIMDSFSV